MNEYFSLCVTGSAMVINNKHKNMLRILCFCRTLLFKLYHTCKRSFSIPVMALKPFKYNSNYSLLQEICCKVIIGNDRPKKKLVI